MRLRLILEEKLWLMGTKYDPMSKQRAKTQFEVYVNPGKDEMLAILNKNKYLASGSTSLRAIATRNDVYVWEECYAQHEVVMLQMEKLGEHVGSSSIDFYIRVVAGEKNVMVSLSNWRHREESMEDRIGRLFANQIVNGWGFPPELPDGSNDPYAAARLW